MRFRLGWAAAAMIGAAGLAGCASTTSLAIQNDTRYPLEVGAYLTSSGSGDMVVPAMATRSMKVFINHGAGSSDFGALFYALPLPPGAPRQQLRWVELASPGPYRVRAYEDGQGIAYVRIEGERELAPGSGRIDVRTDAVKPTDTIKPAAREWKE